MAYGLKVWNSDGDLILDTTDGTLFYGTASSASVTAGNTVVLGTNSDLSSNSIAFANALNVGSESLIVGTQLQVKNNSSSTQTIYGGVFNRGD